MLADQSTPVAEYPAARRAGSCRGPPQPVEQDQSTKSPSSLSGGAAIPDHSVWRPILRLEYPKIAVAFCVQQRRTSPGSKDPHIMGVAGYSGTSDNSRAIIAPMLTNVCPPIRAVMGAEIPNSRSITKLEFHGGQRIHPSAECGFFGEMIRRTLQDLGKQNAKMIRQQPCTFVHWMPGHFGPNVPSGSPRHIRPDLGEKVGHLVRPCTAGIISHPTLSIDRTGQADLRRPR